MLSCNELRKLQASWMQKVVSAGWASRLKRSCLYGSHCRHLHVRGQTPHHSSMDGRAWRTLKSGLVGPSLDFRILSLLVDYSFLLCWRISAEGMKQTKQTKLVASRCFTSAEKHPAVKFWGHFKMSISDGFRLQATVPSAKAS